MSVLRVGQTNALRALGDYNSASLGFSPGSTPAFRGHGLKALSLAPAEPVPLQLRLSWQSSA